MNSIIGVCSTEKATALLEREQTVVLFVSLDATKEQIKRDVEELLNIKPLRVRTVITAKGKKKAYVRLPKDINVDEISAKLKLV